MPWKDQHGLSNNINKRRLILCGPILRRVEPSSVSVFVALKLPRSVKLSIYEGNTKDPSKLINESDPAQTVPLGRYLHLTVVTAKWHLPLKDLEPGTIYGYDLTFIRTGSPELNDDADDPLSNISTLADHGLLTGKFSLGYADNRLPTFSLPPPNLNNLRIIHASCRMPHGESLDAFEALDMMIEPKRGDPNKRPHQLFLTGDQIYADDVADALLLALTDAGDTLLGWEEILPTIEGFDLSPGLRSETMRKVAGYTSTADKSHLISLGEYLAMYMFVWSEELWPTILPEFKDIYPGEPWKVSRLKTGGIEPQLIPVYEKVKTKRFTNFRKEIDRLEPFREALPRVRRALANVPTYMMFDDHEITDDWYLNMKWCEKALSKPLGRRVIQNGLLACALFQAWGNTPDMFEDSQPGSLLLNHTATWSLSKGADAGARARMNTLVGVPEDYLDQVRVNKRLIHLPGSLEWHYSFTGPNHEVIVLDNRTWRGFPGDPENLCALLSDEGFERQIVDQPNFHKDVTIVVAPIPVIYVPFIEAVQKRITTQRENEKIEGERWHLQRAVFESLFAMLARRATVVNEGGTPKRRGRVVFFSGDVHVSYAARFQYWGERPFNDPQQVGTELVAAQLTSSALKKETGVEEAGRTGATHSLHTKGWLPFKNLIPSKEAIGWKNPGGSKRRIGKISFINPIDGRTYTMEVSREGDPIVFEWGEGLFPESIAPGLEPSLVPRIVELAQRPDWLYRIDYLVAEHEVRENAPFEPVDVKAPLPADRLKALQEYLAMAKNHASYATKLGNGKEIVGLNNIGEVTFNWGSGDDKSVTQYVWWRLEDKKSDSDQLLKPFPLTKYVVRLGFGDKKPPQVP